jgi:hypothetical protein
MSISRNVSNTARLLLSSFLLPSLFACSVHASPPGGKNKPDKEGVNVSASVDATVSVPIPGGMISAGISIGDARSLATEHGLTGTKPLPPGIAKNLARGKPLPPGIAKKQLPGPFISQLPHHPGYAWEQAGGDLVLVASGSLVISDILKGVFD